MAQCKARSAGTSSHPRAAAVGVVRAGSCAVGLGCLTPPCTTGVRGRLVAHRRRTAYSGPQDQGAVSAMKAPPFGYVRANTLVEAFRLWSEAGPEAKLLAGGQSLLATLAFRLSEPTVLVDISRVADLPVPAARENREPNPARRQSPDAARAGSR